MHNHIAVMFLVSALAACRDNTTIEPAAVGAPSLVQDDAVLARGFSLIPEVTDPDKKRPPNTPAIVELLSPGAEPRAPLRWIHDTASLNVHVEYREDFYIGDKFRFGLTESGSVRVDLSVDGGKTTARSTLIAHTRTMRGNVPESFPKHDPSLDGASIPFELAATGDVGVLSPEMLKLREVHPGRVSMFRTGETLWAQLPQEAVGVGARWAVDSTSARPTQGTTKHEALVCELTALDGQRGRFSVGMLSTNRDASGDLGFDRRLAWRQDFDLEPPYRFELIGKGTSVGIGPSQTKADKVFRSEFSWRASSSAAPDATGDPVTP